MDVRIYLMYKTEVKAPRCNIEGPQLRKEVLRQGSVAQNEAKKLIT